MRAQQVNWRCADARVARFAIGMMRHTYGEPVTGRRASVFLKADCFTVYFGGDFRGAFQFDLKGDRWHAQWRTTTPRAERRGSRSRSASATQATTAQPAPTGWVTS